MFGMSLGMLLVAFAPWLLGLGGAFYLGLRAVRALESRSQARSQAELVEERFLRIEESMASLSEQMGRLAEGQEFTAKLLDGRK